MSKDLESRQGPIGSVTWLDYPLVVSSVDISTTVNCGLYITVEIFIHYYIYLFNQCFMVEMCICHTTFHVIHILYKPGPW